LKSTLRNNQTSKKMGKRKSDAFPDRTLSNSATVHDLELVGDVIETLLLLF